MKRRVIIWTAMGVALAVAPLAAEARQGRNGGTRRMVLGCGENACVASTGAPTTAALLSDLTDLTTSAPTTEAATSTDATTGSLPAETTTEATNAASPPSETTSASAPSGTDATSTPSSGTTTATSEPSADTTAAATTTTEATTAAETTASVDTAPAPTEPPTEPTPAPTEPTLPPTPPPTVGTPPVDGSFLMSTSNPKVGVPVTFDVGDLLCDPVGACSYTWQWFFRSTGGTILTGGQVGRGQTVTYTFDEFAASKPFVFVTLTVSQGRLGFRHTYTTTFTVTA